MNKFQSIELKAGKKAYSAIMDGGLHSDMIKVMAGAAGGPKWIVLGALDKFIFGEWIKDRQKPLSFLASSVGAWRFAASMAYDNPVKGLELFKEGYFGQSYSEKPTRAEISQVIPSVMQDFINPDTIPRILAHPYGRLHLLAVRSKGLLASENQLVQGTGLVACMATNVLSRKSLQLFFQRTWVSDPRDDKGFVGKDSFSSVDIPLGSENFTEALLATSSIPMVMYGVKGVSGAPKGIYRDGGLIDYHLTMNYQLAEGEIVFQPHFFEQVKPGWFDKKLSYRKAKQEQKKHVLLLYPSQELIDTLPGGYVPDRKDFENFSTQERIARWEQAYQLSERIRDDFAELVLSNKIREKLKLWK